MSKKFFLLVFFASLFLMAGSTLYADSACHQGGGSKVKKATPSVSRRQVRQKVRIAEGVRSGELTREETKGLIEGQKEIREMKQQSRQDGVVTREERLQLQKKLHQESENIYQQKHDSDAKK